jgi:gliding motility-associated-like protein
LAQNLVGFGITVTNATINCPSNASGLFTATSSNLNIDSGLILSSGSVVDNGFNMGVANPSSTFASTPNTPNNSDPDLALLTGLNINDACVLEFDFTTIGDTVKFDYVFGSEEYSVFTCSSFFDMFGFFISGPGITGPYSNNSTNIALVPGTNCPVGVNTINASTQNPCGNVFAPCAPPNNALFNTNNGGTTIVYSGFTDVLTAISPVVPCSTYHLKLVIADGSDQSYDSGVFLKAGSFTSNVVQVKLNAGLSNTAGNQYIIEGCDSAQLTIKRKIVSGVALADTVNFLIQGSAINSIDYTTLPSQVTFLPLLSDTMQILNLFAFNDGITEGIEEIKIYVLGGCGQIPIDSLIIEIHDSLSYSLFNNDTSMCLGNTITINGQVDNGINIQWNPATYVQNPNALLTTITPTTYGVQNYTVIGTYGSCVPVVKNIKITTDPVPIISAIPDMEVCEGLTLNINGVVSPAFNYNITWNPASGLSNTNTYNPTFTGTTSQAYNFNVESPNAKCSANEPFNIQVWPFVVGTISNDSLVCNGENVQLFVTGGTGNYLWYPGTGLSCTSCSNPIASNIGSTTYYAILLDTHGCDDTLDVTVEIQPGFTLQLLNNDTTIYLGEEVQLLATGAPYYYWTPGDYLGFTQSNNPVARPLEDITYTVTGVNINQKCPQKDTVRIKVISQDVFVPNAFSPNGDGKNDMFKITARKLITLQEYRIYNRWGQEIFISNDINKGWDGTYKGVPQDGGIYFYTMKVSYVGGKVQNLKGDITLVR